MPIIFGWGRQTVKQIGIVFKNLCSHCKNEDHWVLTRITKWFTLFFIPVIPYSIKYFLSCPICQYGLVLDDGQVERIRPLAEANQLLIDSKITQEEHQARLQQLNNTSADHIETEVVESNALPISNEKLSYCTECGTKVTREVKFCENCGTKAISK